MVRQSSYKNKYCMIYCGPCRSCNHDACMNYYSGNDGGEVDKLLKWFTSEQKDKVPSVYQEAYKQFWIDRHEEWREWIENNDLTKAKPETLELLRRHNLIE